MGGTDGTESTADTEAAVDTEKTVETESEEQTGLSTESLEATRVSKVASALGASGAGKPVTESGTGTSSSEAAEKSNAGTSSSEAAEQSDAGTSSSEAAEPSGTKKSKTVTVKVRQGDVCREVALKLQKNGLVSDADAFRDYMQNKGYDQRISIGTFQFQKGMTYEEIADILIGKA
jgi:hypothetical protein